MILNLSAKSLNPHVHYNNPSKNFAINENHDFLIQALEKEVNLLSSQETLKIRNILRTIQITLVSSLGVVTPTMAAEMDGFLPKAEILEIFAYLTGITAIAGVGTSIVLLQAAGVYRMFRKKKEAVEWSNDILKGLAQVTIAPILVGTIVLLAHFLFSSSEWYIPLF